MITLLVDDERMERDGIACLCREYAEGFDFLEARNGQEALELMAQNSVDLVITDIRMPVMDGLRFLERATRLYPRVKYVIYSAYSDFEYAKEAINLSVVDYLLKPIREEEFFALLGRLMEQIGKEREQARQELLMRAFMGMNLPEGTSRDAMSLDGSAMLLYLDRPVLDSLSDELLALARHRFPGAHLLVQNEQECCLAVLQGGPMALPGASELMETISQRLGTRGHGMMTSPFRSYSGMLSSLQEARRLMNSGFFVRDNAVVAAGDLHQTEDFDLFEKIASPQQEGARELAEQLMRLFEGTGVVSSLYMKYSLARRLEQAGRALSPEQIEKILASRSLGELREVLEQAAAQEDRPQSVTASVMDYIRRHYSEDISVDTIADSVFLSGNYLCTLFKKETGRTLVTCLTEYRMNQAMKLLTGTLMKTSEVARQVGYKNPSYFNMIFKNHFGKTPTDVRKGES